MDEDLYEMALHQTIELWRGCEVTRVPGGWIYNFWQEVTGSITISSTFVPFNTEFKVEHCGN